jgi:hypothetical protein
MQSYPEMTGEQLKHEVCKILDSLGLRYSTELYSPIGSSIIGKKRRVDVVIQDESGNNLMHIECKSQNRTGSTEDKLFKAVTEANRDKLQGIPSIIAFSGFGWNEADMRHALLNGAVRIELLEDWLRIYFNYTKLQPDSINQPAGREQGTLGFEL